LFQVDYLVLFGQVRKIWCLKCGAWMLQVCYDLKECAQLQKKCRRCFLEVIFFGVFSGTFGEIQEKILPIATNLPAPTLMLEYPQMLTKEGIFEKLFPCSMS